jgi:hypothetical protein
MVCPYSKTCTYYRKNNNTCNEKVGTLDYCGVYRNKLRETK